MLLSTPPRRFREAEQCSSAEKERPSTQCSSREFGVLQGPASSVKDSPASSVEDLPTSSVQASTTNKYRKRGTPKKNLEKLKEFLRGREEHEQRLQQTTKKRKARQPTDAQHHYRDFVKAMLPLESHGTGPERLRSVAAKWKAQQPRVHQLAQENRSVF